MPGRREGITTDVSGTATVEHVLEIRAVPDLLVNLVLHRVEVVRRPLLIETRSDMCTSYHGVLEYLMVAYHGVGIDEL